MRILITGAGGQLGRALQEVLQSDHDLLPLSHQQADITDPGFVAQAAAWSPDVIVNAAAWTDVDGAEREPTRPLR